MSAPRKCEDCGKPIGPKCQRCAPCAREQRNLLKCAYRAQAKQERGAGPEDGRRHSQQYSGTYFVEHDPAEFPLGPGPFNAEEIRSTIKFNGFVPGTIIRQGTQRFVVKRTSRDHLELEKIT